MTVSCVCGADLTETEETGASISESTSGTSSTEVATTTTSTGITTVIRIDGTTGEIISIDTDED